MKQCKNEMTILGRLKKKVVKRGLADDGQAFISLGLEIEVERDGKVGVYKTTSYARESGKLFKGYVTVANEYKTIEANGRENAEIVRVTGEHVMDMYVKDSELKTIYKNRAIFINRVEGDEYKMSAGTEVECVVENALEEIKDGVPTGRLNVDLLVVGYNDKMSRLRDVKVEKDLAQQFKQIFKIGGTANLDVFFNNYAELKEAEVAAPVFGTPMDNKNVITKYFNEKKIVSGSPISIGAYTPEEVANMKKLIEMMEQEKISTPTKPKAVPAQTGFSSEPIPMSNDSSMPF